MTFLYENRRVYGRVKRTLDKHVVRYVARYCRSVTIIPPPPPTPHALPNQADYYVENLKKLRELLQKFDEISTRERGGTSRNNHTGHSGDRSPGRRASSGSDGPVGHVGGSGEGGNGMGTGSANGSASASQDSDLLLRRYTSPSAPVSGRPE